MNVSIHDLPLGETMNNRSVPADDEFDSILDAASAVLRDAFKDAIKRAYERGQADAIAEMRGTISDALERLIETSRNSGPKQVDPIPSVVSFYSSVPTAMRRRSKGTRATHGEVGQVIDAVFAHRTGLTIAEIHKAATAAGRVLSAEGIGHELRRNEGRKYRRERRLWFPIRDAGGETAAGGQVGAQPQPPSD